MGVELWRDIADAVPGYQVSDRGRVRSNRGRWSNGQWVVAKLSTRKDGYVCVNLNGRTRLIHQLVLRAFRGPKPGMDGRHLDGDKTNNRLSNLAWGTRADNEADKRRHGRDNSGERGGGAKLTWESARAIRREYRRGGITQNELGKRYGVHSATVGDITRNITWKET